MGIIDRVILISSGGNFSERPGINNFPPPERGLEYFTIAAA